MIDPGTHRTIGRMLYAHAEPLLEQRRRAMKDTEYVGFPDMIDAGTYQTTLEEEGIPGGATPVTTGLAVNYPGRWIHCYLDPNRKQWPNPWGVPRDRKG